MTNTPDELEQAVERVGAMILWLEGFDSAPAPSSSPRAAKDLRLLLSERAELVATVERMREELDVAAVHLQIAGGWLREGGDDGQRTKELLRASNRARRAALTTGEER